jgi:transposase
MAQEILVGVERRRRWSLDQKLAIIGEIGIGGVRVCDVVRRHRINRQHVYAWRRELREKGLLHDAPQAGFLPVTLSPSEPRSSSGAAGRDTKSVELLLANGRALRGFDGMSDADLAHLIRVVEQA